jgi:hypothetical protein
MRECKYFYQPRNSRKGHCHIDGEGCVFYVRKYERCRYKKVYKSKRRIK